MSTSVPQAPPPLRLKGVLFAHISFDRFFDFVRHLASHAYYSTLFGFVGSDGISLGKRHGLATTGEINGVNLSPIIPIALCLTADNCICSSRKLTSISQNWLLAVRRDIAIYPAVGSASTPQITSAYDAVTPAKALSSSQFSISTTATTGAINGAAFALVAMQDHSNSLQFTCL